MGENKGKKLDVLSYYLSELEILLCELESYNQDEYFYTYAMKDLIKRYNILLDKYKSATQIKPEPFVLESFDFSSTKKTVKPMCIERFRINLNARKDQIDRMIQKLVSCDVSEEIPLHQMRKCLKLGIKGCPKNPQLENRKVFIGMPFTDKYLDSYEYGIKLALESYGLGGYRADENISNIDTMCKICEEMQKCRYLIFNISGLNPNVMFELGLSHGLGKETLIVKDKETKNISNLANIEYIEYSHAGELNTKLREYFNK